MTNSTALQAKTTRAPPSTNKQNTYPVYPTYNNMPPGEQHINYNAAPTPYVTTPMDSSHPSSQASDVPLALPALQSTSMTSNVDPRANSQPTSTANMVMP
uniref:Uncharacterized protein n=1 Tax=Romanomermis culicivorax TaxID=13658 RepID=A0A915JB09_ROMCU